MKILIDHGTGFVDYTRYVVDGTLSIEDSINVPTLLNFTLAPSDQTFVVPRQNSYVRVVSEIYASGGGYGTGKVLATGFVTNLPQPTYLGLNPHLPNMDFQQLAYAVSVSSDEWLLNTQAVPYIPAFINQTMGQILANIANVLNPGFFDVTSHVMSGDIVPYYQYDFAQTWSDVAKSFADPIRYRYKVLDRVMYFVPFDDKPLGVAYDETTGSQRTIFPEQLVTQVVPVPPVNDCIVVGAIEPQANWENHFVGDGFTSDFKLLHQVFDGATALLLQDDWTEAEFQTNLWNVQDPLAIFSLQENDQPVGALNVNQLGLPTALNVEYILGINGLELGGGLSLEHGEFEFTNTCTGIVGGLYSSTTLTQANCLVGFLLTSPGTVVPTASGASGIVMQPLLNGVAVGPTVTSQINHQYTLQTWLGVGRWDRYERIYKNLNGSIAYGGNQLTAAGSITWAVTDTDLGIYAVTLPQFQPSIVNPVTQFTQQNVDLPGFAVYAPINAQNLNLTLQYTAIAQPPEGALYVTGMSGASGLQLPVLPQNLGPEQQMLMGFGLENQTATVLVNGDVQYLAFYSTNPSQPGGLGIPGVGSRIRHQSWAAGTSVSRVRDDANVLATAAVSGDDGVRSAIFTNLSPQPRTSAECELAAAATVIDRENPQFQGTYTIETVPYKFETLVNPGVYDYPVTGRSFYINTLVRGVTGQSLIANTVRIMVEELRQEVLSVSLDYGPDLYLEKTLATFEERTDNLLLPQDTAPPLDYVHLANAGNTFLDMLNNAQVTNIVNALSGNQVFFDIGQAPVSGCMVRRADFNWGLQDNFSLGTFTTQKFVLPRTNRDQTWYLRQINGSQISRFSKALRVNYPLIPSPPVLLSSTQDGIQFQLNGDIRDIYGLEVRFPVRYNLPDIPGQPGARQTGDEVGLFSRYAIPQVNATGVTFNTTAALIPDFNGAIQTQLQVNDIALVICPANSSFNGLKLISAVVGTVICWTDYNQPFPLAVGDGTNPQGAIYLFARGSTLISINQAEIVLGSDPFVRFTVTGGANPFVLGDSIIISAVFNTASGPVNTIGDSAFLTGLWEVVDVVGQTFNINLNFNIQSGQIANRNPRGGTGVVNQITQQGYQPGTFAITGVAALLPPEIVIGSVNDQKQDVEEPGSLTGVLVQKPIFAPSDLSISFTDPAVQQAVFLMEAIGTRNALTDMEAFFFNLTWDYSEPCLIPSVTIPIIDQLVVNESGQSLQWELLQGVPTGYRISTSDVLTGITYTTYAVDNPANSQSMLQAAIPSSEFNAPRAFTVTPYDNLGDGYGDFTIHIPTTLSTGASGFANPNSYTIGCTLPGTVSAGEFLVFVPLDQPITFAPNWVPSQLAFVDLPANGPWVCSLQKNGVQVGTMTIPANAPAGIVPNAFSAPSVNYNVGDILGVIAPATADTNAGRLGFTISASKVLLNPGVAGTGPGTSGPAVSGTGLIGGGSNPKQNPGSGDGTLQFNVILTENVADTFNMLDGISQNTGIGPVGLLAFADTLTMADVYRDNFPVQRQQLVDNMAFWQDGLGPQAVPLTLALVDTMNFWIDFVPSESGSGADKLLHIAETLVMVDHFVEQVSAPSIAFTDNMNNWADVVSVDKEPNVVVAAETLTMSDAISIPSVTVVQKGKATNNTITLTNVTAGNAIVICYGSGSTGTVTSITDTKSNIYTTMGVPASFVTGFTELWWATTVASGTTVITMHTSAAGFDMYAYEVAISNHGGIDVKGSTSNGASSTSIAGISFAGTGIGDLFIEVWIAGNISSVSPATWTLDSLDVNSAVTQGPSTGTLSTPSLTLTGTHAYCVSAVALIALRPNITLALTDTMTMTDVMAKTLA